MGLFDKFKKNNKKRKIENDETNAPVWDAITELCNKVFPEQKNPKHYGTLISWKFGGNDSFLPQKGTDL